MAMNRYGTEKYATIELNHVSWPNTARVFAQLPLKAEDFSVKEPCENGMWVVYDMAKGHVRKAGAATENVGVVFNAEKEYNPYISGMNQYALVPGSYNPRIGMPEVGDIYTTNCFCYNTSEFENDEAVDVALKACATTPVYLVIEPNQAAPKVTKTSAAAAIAASAVVAQVVKFYTMPNGEKGVKVQFIKC